MNIRYFSFVAAALIVSQLFSCKKISTESSRSPTQYSISLPPGVPLEVAGVGGNKQVTLTWKAPDSDGGRAITDYLVQYSLDGEENWTLVTDGVSAATTATIMDLVSGKTYFFRVAAVNAVGMSNYSERSEPVTLASARTLYFNNAVDGDWQTLGNWWLDDQFTKPATQLPTSIDDVHIVGALDAIGSAPTGVLSNSGPSVPTVANVYVASREWSDNYISIELNVTGLATFDGGKSYLYTDYPENGFAIINGNCRFINGSSVWESRTGDAVLDAVVNGNATFDHGSFNLGTINGNAIFNDQARNGHDTYGNVEAIVKGNAIFNDSSRNLGTITGSASFNDTSSDHGTVLNQKPGAPMNLSGTPSMTNGQMDLAWTAPTLNSAGITGYIVAYKLEGAEEWSTFGNSASTDTNRAVTDLTAGASYVFRVAAVSANGQGPFSGQIIVGVPGW